ncbi:MAG TPA: hypothetical protein VMA86_04500 [Acetobacteraceae bacterium]|nr:hypothetical protein [Acetobacteraceae bacterium]
MPGGLLLVTMQPPSDMEDEFNDWYDTEHFPERRALPGFLSASRWAAVEGWPRYLALYELDSVAALETPEYCAVSGDRASPWSQRVVPRTQGRRRIVAAATESSTPMLPPPHATARLLVARYSGLGDETGRTTRNRAEAGPADIRTYRAQDDLWLLAAFARPVMLADLIGTFGEIAGRGATFFNLYVPYLRSE